MFAVSNALGLHKKLRMQLVVISLVFLMLVSAVTWVVVSSSQEALIEFEAIKLAEIVADQAGAARSAYSALAVTKLKNDGFGAHEASDNIEGHIPLPAQFLRELSKRSQASSNTSFSFKPVSLWNLAEDQGIVDEFQKLAWAELEAQQADKVAGPNDWQPVWRILDKDGEQTLRYLRADPASAPSCVNCHNNLEARADVIARRVASGVAPGKKWVLNDLLGAIEVNVPLEHAVMLAQSQTQHGLFIVVGVTLIGLLGVVLIVFIDSARNKAMTSELSYQATHDSLTGMPNRLHFEMNVTEALAHGSPFAVMLLDLDNFKQINDTLGHEAGDAVLIESSLRIKQAIPETGFVARLGGDEFAVILPDSDQAVATSVGNDIVKVVSKSYGIDSYSVIIGVSIGIAMYPVHGNELTELLRCSDVAMYIAKNAGTNSSVYDSDSDHNHISKLVLNNALREAIVSNKISTDFQPKYSLTTGRMEGVEALARWRSPEHGTIPPDVFIPMAEGFGLIKDLTLLVLNQALQECRRWRKAGFQLTVSVNVSAHSLVDHTLVDAISNALTCIQVPSSSLIIEVTESAMMSDPEKAIVVLQEISDLGVRISIDDYGTGYSSLSYLTTLPLSELKLDKSFINKILINDKDALIVQATVDLTRNLNLTMVAEGVEDAPTLDYLSSIGCGMVQGYFLCRPLSKNDFNKRLPYIYKFLPRAQQAAVEDGQESNVKSA